MSGVHWGPAGNVGASVGHWWLGYQGALGPAGDVRGHQRAGRGCLGHQGASRRCRGIGGSRWTGSPTTLGPSPGSQHFPLVLLGE